jgi:hypothetical protein
MPTILPPNSFDSGEHSALPPDEAAASPGFPGAAADIAESSPTERRPNGSPTPGQELCGAGDLDCIGEIFVGARKLDQLPGIFDQAAITGSDELLYVTLKLMDEPGTRDLPDVPQGLIDAMEPLPLFLQVG